MRLRRRAKILQATDSFTKFLPSPFALVPLCPGAPPTLRPSGLVYFPKRIVRLEARANKLKSRRYNCRVK